ncbi:uncharacterized protein N7473_001791 [Penicillium subrubescens]|uniref:uncharacterized protein n=1 Tax=Penicillium subrubescens TaxID=1316194 RepID=UPI002545961B|nr:uncharacterized protein N7473_001791 [Penicillium subrubescens]KAJ5904875.1 hypothetical protein N7473_001791 [Penicillium subrubescens]
MAGHGKERTDGSVSSAVSRERSSRDSCRTSYTVRTARVVHTPSRAHAHRPEGKKPSAERQETGAESV